MDIPTIPEDSRITLYPIARAGIYEFYKKAVASYWTIGEVSLAKDVHDYNQKLTPGERRFLQYILAFFASADTLVNVNLVDYFAQEIKIPEVRLFYNMQVAMEDIHSEMYSALLFTLCADTDERTRLLAGAQNIESIATMIAYIRGIISPNTGLPERLLRAACVEGIFFTGCFAVIYWLASRNLMPGLAQSNELISRDEQQHTLFSLYLYQMVLPEKKISIVGVHAIFREAADIAISFTNAALIEDMPGMTRALMADYIKTQADNILRGIGYPALYGKSVYPSYMIGYNYPADTSIFERRVSTYQKVTNPSDAMHDPDF